MSRKPCSACSRPPAKASGSRRRSASPGPTAPRGAGCGCGCVRSARASAKQNTRCGRSPTSRGTASARKTCSGNCSTRSSISTMRRAAFLGQPQPATSSMSTPRLANWLDHDLAEIGSGGLKLTDIVSGDGAALLTSIVAVPGEVEDRSVRHRPADARRQDHAGAALPQARLRRRRLAGFVAHAGDQPRARRAFRSRARRRSPLHALLRPYADGDCDGGPRRRCRPRQRPLCQAGAEPQPGRRGRTSRSSAP